MDSSEAQVMSEEPMNSFSVTYEEGDKTKSHLGEDFEINDVDDSGRCAFIVTREGLTRLRSIIQDIVDDHKSKTTLSDMRNKMKEELRAKLDNLKKAADEDVNRINQSEDIDDVKKLTRLAREYQNKLNNFKEVYATYRENKLLKTTLDEPITGRFVLDTETLDNADGNHGASAKTDRLTELHLVAGKAVIRYKKNPDDKVVGTAKVDIRNICTQSTHKTRLTPAEEEVPEPVPEPVEVPEPEPAGKQGGGRRGKVRSRRHERFNLSETSSDHSLCD